MANPKPERIDPIIQAIKDLTPEQLEYFRESLGLNDEIYEVISSEDLAKELGIEE